MGLKEEFEKKFKISFEDWQKQSNGVRMDIARIHPKIKHEFLKMCEEEFCSDRGMAIKWMMDFKNGLLSSPNEILAEKIEVLAKEIQDLKEQIAEKKDVVGMTASGKVMKR